MGRPKKIVALFALLLSALIALTGCGTLEETGRQMLEQIAESAEETSEGQPAAEAAEKTVLAKASCQSYEEEVEPGICSYTVDCDTAKTCGAWADKLIADMEEWYGSLTYSEEWDFDEEMMEQSKEDANVLAEYPVKGNRIDYDPSDEDDAYYAWLWERFAWLIPSAERSMVSRFEVFEHVDLMAYVIQDEEDYEQWAYAANVEQATFETERVLTDIHEFGHLLALNAEQIDPYREERSCKTHMWEEGCANPNSYMYAFYQRFWEDGKIDVEDADNFVSDYAMNDEYEDFAESWSHFVVTPRPKGRSVVDQKISFFYGYPELVMLRADIVGRMASWIERNIEDS